MSLKHIIVTVDYTLDMEACEMAEILRERGQICDVDIRNIGINQKLDEAETCDYDFILVVNRLVSEINSVVVRENKTKMKINQNQMKLVDFMHHIWVKS